MIEFSEAIEVGSFTAESVEVAGMDATNTPFTPAAEIFVSTSEGDTTGQIDFDSPGVCVPGLGGDAGFGRAAARRPVAVARGRPGAVSRH